MNVEDQRKQVAKLLQLCQAYRKICQEKGLDADAKFAKRYEEITKVAKYAFAAKKQLAPETTDWRAEIAENIKNAGDLYASAPIASNAEDVNMAAMAQLADIPMDDFKGSSGGPIDPIMGDISWKIISKREAFYGGYYWRYQISNSNGKFWIIESSNDAGDPDHTDYYFYNSKGQWEHFIPTPYKEIMDDLKFLGGKFLEYTAYTAAFSVIITVEIVLTKGQLTKKFWSRFLINAAVQACFNKGLGYLFDDPNVGDLGNVDLGDAVLQSVDIPTGSAVINIAGRWLLKVIIPALQDVSLNKRSGPVEVKFLGIEQKQAKDIGIDLAFNSLARGVDIGNTKLQKGFNIDTGAGDAPARILFDGAANTTNALNGNGIGSAAKIETDK